MTLRDALLKAGYKLVDQRETVRGRTFIVDDREFEGIGADGKPLSNFCEMYARVEHENRVVVSLKNAPHSTGIDGWLRDREGAVMNGSTYSFVVPAGQQELLTELAGLVRSVVQPGARYAVNYWKYSAPKVATNLEALRLALDRTFAEGVTSEPAPLWLIDIPTSN
jgi:hypothetical protein